jgi:hypothetical protein
MSAFTQEAPGPIVLETAVPSDYCRGFMLAQADDILHMYLIEATAVEYRDLVTSEAMAGYLANVDLITRLSGMQKPASHLPDTSPTYRQMSFEERARSDRREFSKFAHIFTAKLFKVSQGTLEDAIHETIPSIAQRLVHQDINYQSQPRGLKNKDVHASFYRQHVILGESTGSQVFDSVFQRIASLGTDTKPHKPKSIRILKKQWEMTHPGQKFYGN